MPSARVFGPWPEHSNPAASCLQSSCALQTEAVDTAFFLACAHLTRGRCCTSNLIAPSISERAAKTFESEGGYNPVLADIGPGCNEAQAVAHVPLFRSTRMPSLLRSSHFIQRI